MKKHLMGTITFLSIYLGVMSAHAANLQCHASVYSAKDASTHTQTIVTSIYAAATTTVTEVKFEGATPDGNNVWLQIESGTTKSRIFAASGQKLQMQFTAKDGASGVASLDCVTH